jgi:hypothetical protein
MSDKLDKVLLLLTDMARDIGKLTSMTEENTRDLAEHIKRTNLLEDSLTETKKELDKKIEICEDGVEEARAPLKWMKITAKVLGAIVAAIAVVDYINRL